MFFDLAATGDVTYDTDRFKKNEELQILKKKEAEKLKEGANLFEGFLDTIEEDTTNA
jgi:DNA-binding SARP family transcriptional activator